MIGIWTRLHSDWPSLLWDGHRLQCVNKLSGLYELMVRLQWLLLVLSVPSRESLWIPATCRGSRPPPTRSTNPRSTQGTRAGSGSRCHNNTSSSSSSRFLLSRASRWTSTRDMYVHACTKTHKLHTSVCSVSCMCAVGLCVLKYCCRSDWDHIYSVVRF